MATSWEKYYNSRKKVKENEDIAPVKSNQSTNNQTSSITQTSSFDEYYARRKAEEQNKSTTVTTQPTMEIAPVETTTSTEKEKETSEETTKQSTEETEKSGIKSVIDNILGVGGNLLMGLESVAPSTVKYIAELQNSVYRKAGEVIVGKAADKFAEVTGQEKLSEESKKILQEGFGTVVGNVVSENEVLSPFTNINKELNSEELETWRDETIQSNIDKSSGTVGTYLAEIAPSIGQNIGNMAITAVAPTAGTVLFMTSAGGNYLDEAEQRGMSKDQAIVYATVMGGVEGATERFISGKMIDAGASIAGAKTLTKEAIVGITKSFGFSIGENALQEALTEPINELTAQTVAGEEAADWENIGQRMLKSGLDGAISGVILGGVSAGVGSATRVYNKMQSGESVSETEISQAVSDTRDAGVYVDNILIENIKEAETIGAQQIQQGSQDNSAQIQGLQESITSKQQELQQATDTREQQIIQEELDGLNQELAEATNAQQITEEQAEEKTETQVEAERIVAEIQQEQQLQEQEQNQAKKQEIQTRIDELQKQLEPLQAQLEQENTAKYGDKIASLEELKTQYDNPLVQEAIDNQITKLKQETQEQIEPTPASQEVVEQEASQNLESLVDEDIALSEEENIPMQSDVAISEDTTPISQRIKDTLGLTNKETNELYTKVSQAQSIEQAREILEDYKTIKENVQDDEVKAIRKSIWGTKLDVSNIKKSITDYNTWRKSNYGKLRLGNDGLAVDSFYQELSEQYPNYFDSNVTNELDQLERLSDFMANNKANYEQVLGEISNEDLNKMAEEYYTEVHANEFNKATENTLTLEDIESLIDPEQIKTDISQEVRTQVDEIKTEIGNLQKQLSEIAPVIQQQAETIQEEVIPTQETLQPTQETAPEAPQLTVEPQTLQTEQTIPVTNTTAQNVNTEVSDSNAEIKQRSWAKTSTESDVINEEIKIEDLDPAKISYAVKSNASTLEKANAKIDSLGYDKAVEYFDNVFNGNARIKAEDVALGQRLAQEALKKGDKAKAIELIENTTILGTELGQATQALSIIQKMTPAGQLKVLEKTVDRAKLKGDKAFNNVEVTDEMKNKILNVYNEDGVTYDQDKLNETMDSVKQDIADQMEATTMDKINAWRYLSMLGNPKTHIRNLVSNVAMKATTTVKNSIARTIEDIVPIENKTKTWKKSTQEVSDYAKQTTLEMKDQITGDSKYGDESRLKQLRKTFETEILEKTYNFNSNLLEKEDWWFSKGAFESSFREFLTANGIETQQDIQNNPELVEKGKLYATEQAQIATFRQYSWLANKISEVENKNAATQVAVGSILPFKKTPINIAKTGLSYSPLGFAKTLTYDVSQVKKGNMEASTLIDHLAQNTTGTALTLVGYMLASAGFLNGAGDDDKEGKYDSQLGEQAYSLKIGDKTYSLSWLSPVAMPLFVGANAFEQLTEGKEMNGDVVVETLSKTLDPLNEISFLSSLTDVLSSYDTGVQKFAGIFETMAQSYATQFIPTLSSQVAGTTDDLKRTTKVSGDSGFKFFDETINKIKYKIPGLRQTLEPSTDIWGNEVEQSNNLLERAYDNFISPYTEKENIATDIDENIKEVFNETGDNGVIPSVPYNYVNFDNEKYNMSAEQYTEFKETYGQTANELLEDLFRTTTYKEAGAEEKADMINDVYDYAGDIAKKDYLSQEGVTYTNSTQDNVKVYKENDIKNAIKNDMTVDEYKLSEEDPDKYNFLQSNNISYSEYEANKEEYNYAYDYPEKYAIATAVTDYNTYKTYADAINDLSADKDSSGKSISGSRKAKVYSYVNSLALNIAQKAMIIKTEYSSETAYNNDIVQYVSGLDISYDQKKQIITSLGMTVNDDGTVSWK